ncbi:helix-turn-helix transcriptional regulator [Echinicola sp. CAU 1574]|uniref:Helix-turn-helix transcriptional regulator n=1 Tax=Echinicola arenosa TaxID=2774144 RepID=A0ABR9AMW4_9BACT|nr:helix-turn-helix transcriptional regulator [Echinicola arenosa]MBD8490154.1 helix-turn-helix transcriptional regulator [Echinicola arenosa]
MKGKKQVTIDLSQLAKNLKSLRIEAKLSIYGVEAATGFSSDHIRQLERTDNQVNPNTKTLLAYSNLYNVSIDDLLKKDNIGIGKDLTVLSQFKNENIMNKEYFHNKNSLPDFLLSKVLPHPEMKKGLKISEIISIFSDYDLKSKAVSREMSRLVEKGIVVKEDKTGTGAVFHYKTKK